MINKTIVKTIFECAMQCLYYLFECTNFCMQKMIQACAGARMCDHACLHAKTDNSNDNGYSKVIT